jgi:spermidine synthase
MHGLQFAAASAHGKPTSYYSHKSAVGQVLEYYQHESVRSKEPLRVGVIGLGVGTLAAYVYLPRHSMQFYEINPEVVRLAEQYFTFLADARKRSATVEIVLGDGRLSLERELKEGPQDFDLLVLDAFSSDSIPIHLLTQEAFAIYLPHLAPGGAMAVHISNRHLDLAPVVYGLAEHFELDAVRIFSNDVKYGGWEAEWIILSRNKELLETLRAAIPEDFKRATPTPPLPIWTDQRHNLLEILK